MEIEIRRIDKKFLTGKVVIDDTTVDLGTLDYADCSELIEKFEQAAFELRSGWDY